MKVLTYSLAAFLSIGSPAAQVVKNNGAFIGTSDGVYVGFQDLINGTGSEIKLQGGHLDINSIVNDGTITLESELTTTGTITNNGTFSLLANASLIDGGSITGNDFTLEEEIMGNGPKYLSSPVSGALADVFTGAFVYSYNENSSEWDAITSGSTALSTLTGFSVEYQKNVTVTYTGRPNSGSLNKALSNTGDGWNLVGNSYPSAVDWDDVSGWTKTNIGNAIYMWDATNKNYTTYLGSAEEASISVNVDVGTDASIIPKMQAFFVKASGASPSLAVDNNARVHSSKEIIGNARVKKDQQFVKLLVEGQNGHRDELVVRSIDFASKGFDPQFDAFKLLSPSNEVPQIYSLNEFNEPMAINSVGEEFRDFVFPLGFESHEVGTFKFSLVDHNLIGTEVFLVDKKENAVVDMGLNSHEFHHGGISSDRFELHFSSSVTGLSSLGNEQNVFTLEDGLLIKNLKDRSPLNLKVFDLRGAYLLSFKKVIFQNQSFTFRPDLPSGVYLVEGVIGHEKIKSKLFIK